MSQVGNEIEQARAGLLTPQELATMLQCAVSTLATWRRKRCGPAYTKLGKQVFYRKADIETWIVTQTIPPLEKPVDPSTQLSLPV